MKKLTLFHLTNCPYCHNARRALDELTADDPRYGTIAIDWVEESEQAELAAKYDYYYVPTVFADDEKLYEAEPGESYEECKAKLKATLDAVLKGN